MKGKMYLIMVKIHPGNAAGYKIKIKNKATKMRKLTYNKRVQEFLVGFLFCFLIVIFSIPNCFAVNNFIIV